MQADPQVPPTRTPGSNRWADLLSGFLVFLIALPLCLAIANASGFPPIAGIWTAVAGGLLCTFLSNSQMTIKGPAAGLIVIVAGAVLDLGKEFGGDLNPAEKALLGYRLALGIGVVSGVIQILFGLLRAGRLADFFPLTPVHGMLAAIGLIIIAKQGYGVLGAEAPKEAGPLALLTSLPWAFGKANPEIFIIGGVSLAILFGLPLLRWRWAKRVPAQLVVLVVAIGLGFAFDLQSQHKYLFPQSLFPVSEVVPSDAGAKLLVSIPMEQYELGPKFLVTIPDVLRDPLSAFAFPDFRGLATFTGLQYLLLFALIGSLESVLSARAIDMLDPLKRKTDFDRDLLAVGVANTAVAFLGGLPMISEIVRSSANINNGAKTRMANFYHGICLLVFVLLFPRLIHSIPLAALAAMLVYTGSRLASPREFVRTYRVGTEQFAIFVTTIVVVLATDLLVGILSGIALKLALHLWHGAPFRALLAPQMAAAETGEGRAIVTVQQAAVFSNWMTLRAAILVQLRDRSEVVVDLSGTRLVDHSVMEKLHELQHDLATEGKRLVITGLEGHLPLSRHPMAARRRLTSV